jgi:hypothetical protein
MPCGTTWSYSSRVAEPQTAPPASGHWHLPASRSQTSRFTAAVILPGAARIGFTRASAPTPRRLR